MPKLPTETPLEHRTRELIAAAYKLWPAMDAKPFRADAANIRLLALRRATAAHAREVARLHPHPATWRDTRANCS